MLLQLDVCGGVLRAAAVSTSNTAAWRMSLPEGGLPPPGARGRAQRLLLQPPPLACGRGQMPRLWAAPTACVLLLLLLLLLRVPPAAKEWALLLHDVYG
jgi:hypothetical protein